VSKKELEKTGANLPAYYGEFQQEAAVGSEHVTTEEIAIPWLQVLQALSPQCTEGDAAFNPELRPGMILENVSGRAWPAKAGPLVVPCAFHPLWIEWTPRNAGGGFVRRYALGEAPPGAGPGVIRVETPEGNEVLRTHYHYVLILHPPDWTCAVVAMKATQLKYSQRWNNVVLNTRIEGPQGRFVPPRFAQKYTLNSIMEKNDQGSWHSWQIVPAGLLNLEDPFERAVYAAGKEFHAAVEKGAVKVDENTTTVAPASDGEAAAPAAGADKDLPF
jgi:hypothetical protein